MRLLIVEDDDREDAIWFAVWRKVATSWIGQATARRAWRWRWKASTTF